MIKKIKNFNEVKLNFSIENLYWFENKKLSNYESSKFFSYPNEGNIFNFSITALRFLGEQNSLYIQNYSVIDYYLQSFEIAIYSFVNY